MKTNSVTGDVMENFKSQVLFRNELPFHKLDPDTHFLLYDPVLETLDDEDLGVKDFILSFPHRLGLKGGESVKEFKDFSKKADLILKKWPQPISRSQTLVVLGGGSLGDFGGFVASIIKRGVCLIQIPSTWLAAMDSAHGGKTALNRGGIKNQIGSFYPAKKVFIIKNLLETSPQGLKEQSYGEFMKMALIGESQFFKKILTEKREVDEFMWSFIKFCIEDKYHLILKDPFETKKVRQVLNFGHTFGHSLEAHFGWSHGDSVLQGLFFALEWSRYRGDLSQNTHEQITGVLREKFERTPACELNWYRKPGKKAIISSLREDKKMDEKGQILFVFLKDIGKALLKPVPIKDLISEAKRQGWIK